VTVRARAPARRDMPLYSLPAGASAQTRRADRRWASPVQPTDGAPALRPEDGSAREAARESSPREHEEAAREAEAARVAPAPAQAAVRCLGLMW